MKRTLAVLLSLIMIVFSASADGVLNISWSIDSGELGEYLSSCGLNEKSAALFSEAAGLVCQHLFGQALFTDTNGHFELSYNQFTLLDADWKQLDTSLTFHTSILPGIQLQIPRMNYTQLTDQSLVAVESIMTMLQKASVIEEKGRFWGYAYFSGDQRLTYHFDQVQMAEMLSLVMNALGASEIPQIREFLEKETVASSEKKYSFQLSIVSEKGIVTGISAALKDVEEPIAVFSCGLSQDASAHVVFGIGLQDAAYYCDIQYTIDRAERSMNASVDLYSDPYGLGFDAVRSYGMTIGNAILNGSAVDHESGTIYRMEIQLEQEGHALLTQYITCDRQPDSFTITNSAVSPESKSPFFETRILYSKQAVEVNPYTSDSDDVISIQDLYGQYDRFVQAAQSGLQAFLLKMTLFAPELLKLIISE